MKYYTVFYLLIILIGILNARNTYVHLISTEDEMSQLAFQSENKGFVWQNMNDGASSVLSYPKNNPLMTIDGHKSMDFDYPLLINSDNVNLVMNFKNSSLIYDGMEQWTMIAFDDFQGSALGWSKEKLSTCGANDNMFLGGHCNFGGEEVSKNFTGLPKHSMIRVTANFHFFDKWEGEEAFMLFNENIVWSDYYKWCDKVFLWYCKKYAINACGAEFPDRLSVPIDFSSERLINSFNLFL